MEKNYEHYKNITKYILDTIEIGDLVKINNWGRPLRVKAISDNYFLMTQKMFGKTLYSVCEKIPWGGIMHNSMEGGRFHCGTDNWVFGSPLSFDYENLYEFENEEANQKYLQEFENGECELSVRRSVAIYDLYIKRL